MKFLEQIELRSKNIVAISNNLSITYADLYDYSSKFAERLFPDETVFLYCHNNIKTLIAYIGILKANSVPILLNSTLTNEKRKELEVIYKPKFIYDNGLTKTTRKKQILLHNDLCMLLSTSGSMGSSKFVRLTGKNVNSNALAIAQYLNIKETDLAITTMPMNYAYGLSIINSHLAAGACIIFNQFPVVRQQFWNLIDKHKVTTFGGVPYMYNILKRLKFHEMDLPSLEYITQAGGHLSDDLSDYLHGYGLKKSVKVYKMYGQTEATARISYLPWEMCGLNSIGKAIPGGKIWLEDGELVYQGDNVCMGYANSYLDLQKGDENKGILHTGDLAEQRKIYDTSEAYYYIVGRKKRFLKLFGNRINLDELEEVINKKYGECACTGNDSCLKVYTTNPYVLYDIRDYVNMDLKIHHSSFSIEVVKEIPYSNGKIMYSELGKE